MTSGLGRSKAPAGEIGFRDPQPVRRSWGQERTGAYRPSTVAILWARYEHYASWSRAADNLIVICKSGFLTGATTGAFPRVIRATSVKKT